MNLRHKHRSALAASALAAALTLAPAGAAIAGNATPAPAPKSVTAGGSVIDVTAANLAEAKKMSDSKPVVFLVTAPAWCGYCKKLDPVIRKLNAEGQGKWVLAIIDVDKAGGAEKEFGAKGYPTMIAFSKGAEMKNAKRYEGFAGEEGTRTWVDSVVQAAPAPGPTNGPTTAPTNGPTTGPAPAPTDAPTTGPAPAPTDAPTTGPAPAPTDEPTDYPTDYPTDEPTDDPTDEPTDEPTWDPGDEDWGDWDDDGEWLTRSQFMPLNQAPQAKAKALAQAKAPVKR